MTIHIVDNIKRWQQSETPSFIDKPISTHEYLINLAITAQNEIGWDNLLRGLLTPIWNACHRQWEKESNIQPKYYSWNHYNSKEIIMYRHNLWCHRCADDKEKIPSTTLELLQQESSQILQKIINNPSIVMAHDIKRLKIEQRHLRLYSIIKLKVWYLHANSSINMKNIIEKNKNNKITRYFERQTR